MGHIVAVQYDNWQQIFNDDGTLLVEGHSITAEQFAQALHLRIEQLDMSVLPNANFEVDNIVAQRDLSAVREALARGR
jgi:hypothetical protein